MACHFLDQGPACKPGSLLLEYEAAEDVPGLQCPQLSRRLSWCLHRLPCHCTLFQKTSYLWSVLKVALFLIDMFHEDLQQSSLPPPQNLRFLHPIVSSYFSLEYLLTTSNCTCLEELYTLDKTASHTGFSITRSKSLIHSWLCFHLHTLINSSGIPAISNPQIGPMSVLLPQLLS